MSQGLSGKLQHPRRSLGDRHRSQATKFVKLAQSDSERFDDNYGWAEQNARQALLFDFTHPDNWRVLANIKAKLDDEIGLRALLGDLFSVLGRDPEQVSQLDGVSILDVGVELLEAALSRDHLDPDLWFESLQDNDLIQFSERILKLDLSDPRCNVLFGRRIERLWNQENTQMCMELARVLLANRPQNFELWLDLGRAHERLESFDEAWLCYDQAESYAPHLGVREAFRKRMELQLDNAERTAWVKPTLDARDDFLLRMQKLASSYGTEDIDAVVPTDALDDDIDEEEAELIVLLEERNYSAAFFLARRIITRGDQWAKSYLESAQAGLNQSDNVEIP